MLGRPEGVMLGSTEAEEDGDGHMLGRLVGILLLLVDSSSLDCLVGVNVGESPDTFGLEVGFDDEIIVDSSLG